jgi:hypothetical protein
VEPLTYWKIAAWYELSGPRSPRVRTQGTALYSEVSSNTSKWNIFVVEGIYQYQQQGNATELVL